MASQKKIDTVKKIKEELANTKSVVLADHAGLTHLQMEKLRKNVKKAGGNYLVIKNALLKKALVGTAFEGKLDENSLTGPTSVLLSVTDEFNPLKELVKTSKELNLPKIKSGALSDRTLTSADVIRLSALPGKDVLIAQLLGMLKSPQQRMVYTLKGNLMKLVLILKAVSENKQTN